MIIAFHEEQLSEEKAMLWKTVYPRCSTNDLNKWYIELAQLFDGEVYTCKLHGRKNELESIVLVMLQTGEVGTLNRIRVKSIPIRAFNKFSVKQYNELLKKRFITQYIPEGCE